MTADDTVQTRIASLRLEAPGVVRYGPDINRERQAAIKDLLAGNHFRILEAADGPYDLVISQHGNELVFEAAGADQPKRRIAIGLSAFRSIIKDYFTLCESYYDAVRHQGPAQIETVDMGRRGLHNEGAEMLRRRLSRWVEVDLPTARRLFTLICVLQIRH